MARLTLSLQSLVAIGAFALAMASGDLKAQDTVSSPTSASPASPVGPVLSAKGGVTVLNVRTQAATVDFVHAQPKALPINPFAADSTQALMRALGNPPDLGPSVYSSGAKGSGAQAPLFLGKPELAPESEVAPQAFGTTNHPFTTARADLFGGATNTLYPYRAAGKLFFNEAGGSFICSASLIKRGVAVTAAHCVADYGKKQFYTGWQFVPGYRNGAAPFGVWTVRQAVILTSYYDGTGSCAVSGIVCSDDVAVLILDTQKDAYAGSTTGWFGYWYGGGFTSNGLVQITQLGYPAGLDNAAYMERNDSQGYKSSSDSNNTLIGSNMNGGSSGGPWIANFGLPNVLTGESSGSGATFTNAVVGVTSWGYTSNAPKEQGASPFTSGNIQKLLDSACGSTPAACS